MFNYSPVLQNSEHLRMIGSHIQRMKNIKLTFRQTSSEIAAKKSCTILNNFRSKFCVREREYILKHSHMHVLFHIDWIPSYANCAERLKVAMEMNAYKHLSAARTEDNYTYTIEHIKCYSSKHIYISGVSTNITHKHTLTAHRLLLWKQVESYTKRLHFGSADYAASACSLRTHQQHHFGTLWRRRTRAIQLSRIRRSVCGHIPLLASVRMPAIAAARDFFRLAHELLRFQVHSTA